MLNLYWLIQIDVEYFWTGPQSKWYTFYIDLKVIIPYHLERKSFDAGKKYNFLRKCVWTPQNVKADRWRKPDALSAWPKFLRFMTLAKCGCFDSSWLLNWFLPISWQMRIMIWPLDRTKLVFLQVDNDLAVHVFVVEKPLFVTCEHRLVKKGFSKNQRTFLACLAKMVGKLKISFSFLATWTSLSFCAGHKNNHFTSGERKKMLKNHPSMGRCGNKSFAIDKTS